MTNPVRGAILKYLYVNSGWNLLTKMHDDLFEGYTYQNTYYHCCNLVEQGLAEVSATKATRVHSSSYRLTSEGRQEYKKLTGSKEGVKTIKNV